MKKLLLILSIGLLAVINGFSQTINTAPRDSVAFYMIDKSTMAHGPADARFLRLIIKTKSKLYQVEDYYPDGTPRLVATTQLQQMRFEDGAQGAYTEYYPNGNKKIARNYKLGELAGDDTTFYANGQPFNVVSHSGAGVFLKTYVDSTGKLMAEKGNGFWLSRDEDRFEQTFSGQIVNGKEEGIWVQRYAGDTTAYKVEFKNGIVVPGTDKRQAGQVFTAVDQQPRYGVNDYEFAKYLAHAVRYPKYARENNITGRVIVTFVVEKDGSLSDLKILKSPDESLSEEALRVMKLSPKWRPGMQHGRPVRVQYSMPVAFALATSE